MTDNVNKDLEPVVEDKPSFDPSTLSEEAKQWFEKEKQSEIDRRVTGAVKTATERVKQETAKELRESIRKELEDEATLSAEEKVKRDRELLAQEMTALKKDSNAFLVKKELITYGFDDEAIEKLTSLVVTDDKDVTLSKLKELTDTFNSTLTARVEKEKLSLLASAGTPPAGGNQTVSEKAEYLAKFNEAKQAKDETAAARIIRESQAKGINIF